MATIKDVAKEAGVSLGTVSNVLNHKGNVSPENVKRVQEAVNKLGYTPDATARSLKTNRTMNIGVILPNITDPNFAKIFTGIERILSECGYTTALYTTSEIPAKENLLIERICQQRMDGVILVSCQPEKLNVFQKIEQAGIKMVFLEREIRDADYNYFGYNNYRSLYDVTFQQLKKGITNVFLITGPGEYSSERQCIEGYKKAYTDCHLAWDQQKILQTNCDKESAFKTTVKLLRETMASGGVVITSSTQILDGVRKALSFLEIEFQSPPELVSLSEETWIESLSTHPVKRIPRKAIQLGELAAETLIENIKRPALFEYLHRTLDNHGIQDESLAVHAAVSYETKPARSSRPGRFFMVPGERSAHDISYGEPRYVSRPLKVLMLRGSAAYATSALLPDFTRQTGINVSIDTLDYDGLYEMIVRELCAENYDLFQIDLPWFPELADAGCLVDLSEFIERRPEAISDYIPGVLDAYSKYRNSYFALPYMFGTQLLFYRKDLFEDPELQVLFQEQYQSELLPPKTWTAFNVIARFFTRASNPHSPVLYGTTLGGKYSSGAICEFLPRQWSYGGRTLDESGHLVLNSKETLRALQNYVESYQYASEGSVEHWWAEQADEFSQGMAAMMILFVAHATEITDRSKSKVVGKIGYATIPGANPMLGGWSLGINRSCQRPQEAFQFISWATCREMAIPYTILGGATPSINLYKSSELLSIYPWLPRALESFSMSRKRGVSKITTHGALTEREYEKILGEAVHQAITQQLPPEEAIRKATDKLQTVMSTFSSE